MARPNPARDALADRLRDRLAGESSLRETMAFGGLAFMVDDAMTVSAQKTGDLLVRVGAERAAALLAEPGASQAEMGRGRSMSPGWITVSADVLVDDARLDFWVAEALAFNRG